MLQSLKNIFSSDQILNDETENTEIDILSGLMIEAANTDGEVTQEELNKKLKLIENEAGRDRNAAKFSSRTLDIDIVLQIDESQEILFESEEIDKYAFVSEPLKELL